MNIPSGRSESLIELTKALAAFQGAITSVPKKSINPFFHSKYADLDAVWDVCRKPLSENGLALMQMTTERDERPYLETWLLHKSGEYVTFLYPLSPMRQTKGEGWVPANDPQAVALSITYARRYAMSAMLGITSDEDDDAESAMSKSASRNGNVQPQSQSQAQGTTASRTATMQRGEACAEHLKLWAPGPQGRIGHPLGQGLWHWKDELADPLPAPEYEDTPLGEFQRELAESEQDWDRFQTEILCMPWAEWIRLGGTIQQARQRWVAAHAPTN